ncbi:MULTISPECIES: LtrD [unclassified Enterococcus]|uniref:LtrD n=1 Tax=unclassified Enterococcus TaxID=2608891 RepID=UPI001CE064C7|nr:MULTISPECIES: LtrD [unclassified Enterococcus]MCA5014567.1 LtrD [Enterococcus sp. S23]MCA5017820.1 LtrD [Enterococcus sp. S22(2020)]
MEVTNDEVNYILVQLFLDDPTSETPRIHVKKREKRQGALIKELDTLINDYEELETDIDISPYKEAVKILRKIKGKDAFNQFVDDLLRPYEF